VFETPPDIALTEHRAQANSLAAAGVDLLMVETMPTATEAAIALQAAVETGLPATVGFVCAWLEPDRQVRLVSGETLALAVKRVSHLGPDAIFVNCAAPAVITAALGELRELTTLPLGAYANVGHVDQVVGWAPDEALTGDRYAQMAREWIHHGARVVGGCCGTHPEHTAALRGLVDSLPRS
jgi:homocysteine S-methyltransferase